MQYFDLTTQDSEEPDVATQCDVQSCQTCVFRELFFDDQIESSVARCGDGGEEHCGSTASRQPADIAALTCPPCRPRESRVNGLAVQTLAALMLEAWVQASADGTADVAGAGHDTCSFAFGFKAEPRRDVSQCIRTPIL